MKIIKKVSRLQVKRCFVVANLLARRTNKGHVKRVESTAHYMRRLKTVRSKVLKMSEGQLDRRIGGEWQGRLDAYNASEWFLANATITELGVWSKAGELPLRWTNQSLAETALKVRRALGRRNGFRHQHIRAAHAVKGILRTSVDVIQDEVYLLPIVFTCDTGTRGRSRLKRKMRGDIDDGCMRSIALAVNGQKTLKVYFGKPTRHTA